MNLLKLIPIVLKILIKLIFKPKLFVMQNVNWRELFFAILLTITRWLQDELTDDQKTTLRRRERVKFPEDVVNPFNNPAGEVIEEKVTKKK